MCALVTGVQTCALPIWVAQLDRRTCPSCWSQHGSKHALDEPGPLDHQQGRCARLPVTRSWRDLGFDIDDPPSVVPDAETTFRGMRRGDQTGGAACGDKGCPDGVNW